MLIPEITESMFDALHDIWDKNFPRLPDKMRDPDLLDYWLFQDQGATQLYLVDDRPTLSVVGSIEEGLNATVLLLNHEFSDVGQILRELRSIIEQWDLRRITANVPAPVKEVSRTLEQIGFRREGHLRRSAYWNGRLVGTDIFALYRDPPREARRSNGERRSGAAPAYESRSQPQSRSPVVHEAPAARPDSAVTAQVA